MNVFESLIEELKREELIEQGVIETESPAPPLQNFVSTEESKTQSPIESEVSEVETTDSIQAAKSSINESDFYRRRAMEEVTSLQMVEHIFSGVERDQMKIVPQTYDSIPVSRALHEYLRTSNNSNSESSSAELTLMQETESWYTALSYRDRNILPAQLRRYCETVKPGLSVQAVAALTRFYRNSPYSESVRSKFDMIVTRLFSREGDHDLRELAFDYQDIVQHLSELYADWASISIYATDDETQIKKVVAGFENFIREAETANHFEELIKSDFFNRLRAYKEQSGENFYAPQVTATVIECNVRVGNVYIKLLQQEKVERGENLENKYGFLLDQTISEATSKTLRLTNLLEGKKIEEVEESEPEIHFEEAVIESEPEEKTERLEIQTEPDSSEPRNFNKLLIAAVILGLLIIGGLFFWKSSAAPRRNTQDAEVFQLDGHYFKDYLKSAKINNGSFVGNINLNWSNISTEKKQEVLKNILLVGKEKGFRSVQLQTEDGQPVAFAEGSTIKISN